MLGQADKHELSLAEQKCGTHHIFLFNGHDKLKDTLWGNQGNL